MAQAQSITPATDGTGTVVNIDGNTYTINGGTLSGDGQNLFHSFESFGLTQQEIADFLSNPEIQNILGRISGGTPSQINGLLQVSGGVSNLYLMNPAGIVFGPNAQLNVPGSFAAVTANSIDFAAGEFGAFGDVDYQALVGAPQGFSFAAETSGSIVNTGDLAVSAGNDLVLLGDTIVNTGTLTAPGGTITVAAIPETQQIRISQDGMVLGLAMNADALSQVPTDQSIAASLPDLVTGGVAEIASTIQVDEQGRVWLTGSQTMIPDEPGTVIVSGAINAASETTPGGIVQVLGEQVALVDAAIDASGTSGGDVFIGGDLQGGGDLPTAQYTVVDASSVVQADALSDGDGGQVIVWADGTTQFAGEISARGGENSGNGGFVEVSGLETLSFTGEVITDAPNGLPGTLLLDPTDITITAGGIPGGFNGQVLFGDVGPTVISEAQIESLAGNTNVTIQATNSITIDQMQDLVLTFQPGVGTISFDAGGTFTSNSEIRTNYRNISISAASIVFDAPTNIDIITGIGASGPLNGDAGSINLNSTSGGISFESITAVGGISGNPGDINISVSPGNPLSFEKIESDSAFGDGSITINGIAQPGGTLLPNEVVGGVPIGGGGTPGSGGGVPIGGGGTPGSGGGAPGGGAPGGGTTTIDVGGAIITGVTNPSPTSTGNLGTGFDPSIGITIPGVGGLSGFRVTANNAQALGAFAQSEIAWNETFQDVRAWDRKWAAREAQSRAEHDAWRALTIGN